MAARFAGIADSGASRMADGGASRIAEGRSARGAALEGLRFVDDQGLAWCRPLLEARFGFPASFLQWCLSKDLIPFCAPKGDDFAKGEDQIGDQQNDASTIQEPAALLQDGLHLALA